MYRELYGQSPLNSPERNSVIEHISRPIFLHFFDREMQTTLGEYKIMPEALIYEDFLLMLLSTYETAYMSAAQVFEHKFARSIFWRLLPLFQKGHIQGVMGTSSLRNFLFSKREQYLHVKELYPFYFDDTWEHITSCGPIYRRKEKDTTTVIGKELVTDLQTTENGFLTERLGLAVDRKEVDALKPYIVEALELRGKRAITKLLFTKPYQKYDSSFGARQVFDMKISESYVRAYLDEYDGTIVTGLRSEVDYFRYLCPTFPFHHLPLWRQANLRLGCISTLRSLRADEILMIREASEFQYFVDEFRYFLARLIQGYDLFPQQPAFGDFTLLEHLERAIRVNLYPIATRSKGADHYLSVLERATMVLRSLDLAHINPWQKAIQGALASPGREEGKRTIRGDLLQAKDEKEGLSESRVKKVTVYISSAPVPEDEALLHKLMKHLSMVERQPFTSFWYKQRILPGGDRKQEISHRLDQANLIVFLLSPDFLASDECYEEIEVASRKMVDGNVFIIPILVRYLVGWQNTPLGGLQALPIDLVPIIGRFDQDRALYESVRYIDSIIENIYRSL